MDKAKQQIVETVDAAREDLLALSKTSMTTRSWASRSLRPWALSAIHWKKHGFTVQRGYGGLETSFRADLCGSGEGPTVAFLAEYDALNGIGHGCGHNLIATCSVGAFLDWRL